MDKSMLYVLPLMEMLQGSCLNMMIIEA